MLYNRALRTSRGKPMRDIEKLKLMNRGRRDFFAKAGCVLGIAAAAEALPRIAHADDFPHLAVDDPTAQALNYTEDTAKIDKAKATTYVAGAGCVNCNFYHGGSTGFGPCDLFPGKAVSAKGWCAGFAKKA
jgi:High potential iron-sulfur protein